MLLRDMFKKPIDREITGVIKVGQDDENVKKLELEEYVVTRELQGHFKNFFENYLKYSENKSDKIGIWISGFFGSGKSHFLKILSYILDNEEIDGQRAIDYFKFGEKIHNLEVLEKMEKVASFSNDVIIFNIDAKSDATGTKSNTLLTAYLRAYNEKLGYSTNYHLADLERELDRNGKYEEFQEKYKENTGTEWKEGRNRFAFFSSQVVDTLVDIGYKQEDAQGWVETTRHPYDLSIEDFVAKIKEYLDRKGEDHHITFLVDEMGQYVGENTALMLNLQTLTEKLGDECRGRAWNIVTSQQDINSITEVVGQDFSKIQGRFDTRVNLTSSNVDEVIKLRVLEKTDTANLTLLELFREKETTLKNLLIFNNGPELKLYSNPEEFSSVYPFVTYQFNVLGKVLTAIRTTGASGKHLSEGERSMLALFKESAEKLKDEEDGIIVPFYTFYDGLYKWLDHSHAKIISNALDNRNINPEGLEENFAVNVLKVLFMIKYVNEVESNVENITTLMISNMDDERLRIKEKVEDALNILKKEMLVQRNGPIYKFLTDEEQDVIRLIENINIESTKVINGIGEIIFADIFSDERISSDISNRYIFNFNRYVDDIPYKKIQNNNLNVKILTQYSLNNGQENNLKMISSSESSVIVDLPLDSKFNSELVMTMRIREFLQKSKLGEEYEDTIAVKRKEMSEYELRAKKYLEDSLSRAKIYVNGSRLESQKSNFTEKVKDGLISLINIVYDKLSYIEEYYTEKDIIQLLNSKTVGQQSIERSPNQNAIDDMISYINLRTRNYTRVSLKEIKNHFLGAPYGFVDLDIQWIMAKLFKEGFISLIFNGVELKSDSPDIYNYISKKQYEDKILIGEKIIIPEDVKNLAKVLSKKAFDQTISSTDPDVILTEFFQNSNRMKNELIDKERLYYGKNYPDKEVITKSRYLLEDLKSKSTQISSYELIRENENELLEFGEKYSLIKNFFEGNQVDIWDRTVEYMKKYEDSRTYINDEEIDEIFENMKAVITSQSPYILIKDLPNLNEKFAKIFTEIMEEKTKPIIENVKEEQNIVKSILENRVDLKEEEIYKKLDREIIDGFNRIIKKSENAKDMAILNSFSSEARELRKRLVERINLIPVPIPDDDNDNDLEPIIEPTITEVKEIGKIVSGTWTIEKSEDVDRYVEELGRKLKKEIKENTTLIIRF